MKTQQKETKGRDELFEKWFDEYFGNAQGEDSPYNYNDVKIAFYKGFSEGNAQCYRGSKAKGKTTGRYSSSSDGSKKNCNHSRISKRTEGCVMDLQCEKCNKT